VPRHEITPEQEATEREKAHRGTRVRRMVYVLVVVVAWLAIGGVGGPTVGRLSEAQQNDNTAFLPRTAESTTVSRLSARFNPSTSLPYFVVVERAGGLTGDDRAAVRQGCARPEVRGGRHGARSLPVAASRGGGPE
jgi:RND superfamily putative drug exporter